MTEDEIRRIVREEVQEEALKVGGIYDHCRTVTFSMLRDVMEMLAKRTLASFEGTKRGDRPRGDATLGQDDR